MSSVALGARPLFLVVLQELVIIWRCNSSYDLVGVVVLVSTRIWYECCLDNGYCGWWIGDNSDDSYGGCGNDIDSDGSVNM